MKRKTKVSITKVLLVFLLGVIGYFIAKAIYLWDRKKRNITKEINLSRILIYAITFNLIFDIFYISLLLFGNS